MSRLRRVPAAAWWCAAIAFVNVAVWGIVTPPFHVPDETSHLSYVQHFAENGEPPNDASLPVFADEQARVHAALLFDLTAGRPFNGTIWSEAQAAGVEAAESADLERGNGGGIQSNSAQPPLYFMVQSVVYRAFSWTDLLDRLMLMRLVGALLAALTTLFTFAFLRELFREPWTWTVGALAVAFQPTLGFISGAVQPDAMLFAASAGLFWMLARTFRRGLTVERGVAIGLLMAAGSLTKLDVPRTRAGRAARPRPARVAAAAADPGAAGGRGRGRGARCRARRVRGGQSPVLGPLGVRRRPRRGEHERDRRQRRRRADRPVRADRLHLAALPAAAAVHERPVRLFPALHDLVQGLHRRSSAGSTRPSPRGPTASRSGSRCRSRRWRAGRSCSGAGSSFAAGRSS